MAMKIFTFKKHLALHHICSRNLGKCIFLSCLSNKKCIYAISKHYFQYFNKLCEERIYFWKKSFGCSPKQIYNGNFRKHSRAALDKMKLYQMGNKTKNLDLAWIYCKWRKLHKPLLDPPPQLSCYKTRQVSRNQGHKQLAKHEIWMVYLLWWPIKVINMFQTYLSEIRKKIVCNRKW